MLFLATAWSSFAQLSESFDTFPPTGWTVESTNSSFTWQANTFTSTEFVGNFAMVPYDYSQDESLISPVFTVPATNPVLTFKMEMSYYWGVDPNNNYDFIISISTDGTTWTPVWDESALGTFVGWDPLDIVVPLTAYAGSTTAQLKFQYIGDDGADLYIDEVNVVAAPSSVPDCATLVSPADAATDVAVGSVVFTWNAPTTGEAPTSYDFYGGTALPLTSADLIGNYTTTTVTLNVGVYSTTLYWMVVPKNLAGEATGCIPYSFTTQAVTPYCLYATNGLYPSTTYTPAVCDGATSEDITLYGYAGEYSNVNVIAGNTYQFSSSTTTDVVTISADDGATAAAYGIGSVSYTPTADGVVRFYTHLDNGACGAESVSRVRSVMCSPPASTHGFNGIAGLSCFPNPTRDMVTISFNKNISNLKVYNALGQMVLAQLVGATTTQLDLSSLASGTYVVKLTADSKSENFKITKQ